jgi:hypothetical protein
VQLVGCAARSAISHWFCGELDPQPPVTPGELQLLLSTTMCQAPMS